MSHFGNTRTHIHTQKSNIRKDIHQVVNNCSFLVVGIWCIISVLLLYFFFFLVSFLKADILLNNKEEEEVVEKSKDG